MNKPSVKTLRAAFGTDAGEARRILNMTRAELLRLPAPAALNLASYHPHKTYTLRLEALNAECGFYGVESIETTNGEYADFLNAGDTYAPTLIYWRGRYRVQSVGDFVETMERQRVHFK